MITDAALLSAAEAARLKAHAPYSRFQVGAALLCDGDTVVAGANVENLSYGLTMCAERVCVGSALQSGPGEFQLLAIVSDSTEPIVPCGACRQVLAEFAPDLRIITRTMAGAVAEYNLKDLLPLPSRGILR